MAGTNNPAERRYLHVRPPETPRDYVTAQHAGTFVSSSEELHRWLEQLRHKFGRLPRTASMGHMTVHAWPCWPPIAARGHRRGRYRQLYLLHGESCRASLLRRQTVAAWAELPHLLHEARERRSA